MDNYIIIKIALGLYLLLVNIVTAAVYHSDKKRAIKHRRRISESTLILLALIGGSAGAFISMRAFYHKTKKPKFYIGVPVIFIVQLAAIIVSEVLFW